MVKPGDPDSLKGDKRRRTREALLDAALALTREKGFEGTTLAEVAARAGMTTGAIYGNFKNRDDLFMALAERQWAPIRPKHRKGDSFADLMRALAQALIDALPERQVAARGALTYRAYALSRPEVRARFHGSVVLGCEIGADWLEAQFSPDELPMPASTLTKILNSLIEGLTFQRFLTGELISDDVIEAAFLALAGRG